MRFLALALPFLVLAPAALAQQRTLVEFRPGGTYDPAVPPPDSVLGYAIGTHHTDYAGLERWLAALRRSERVRVLRYGESVERRPLYLIVVSSPANLARLEEIRAAMAKLADPRTTNDAEAQRIAASMPAVAWMNHANDGNESAAFEAAIQTSYQLAAGTDAETQRIVDQLVVIVNPAHNPESHERFVAWYNSAQVGAGTADRNAIEHHAPWGMSTNNNHYQIDLNRDAFFGTQQETRAIVQAFGEWNPVVFVDHHGQTKNMFFPPPADAVNLNVTANQAQWMDRYGSAIADAFDDRGWSYYRRGRFDLFYAGFWDSWPTLNGSVGLTFETDAGGHKGLVWEREDGTLLTLREGIARHHTGAMAVLRVTAEQRAQRLADFYAYRRSAIAEGTREAMRQVVLFAGADPGRAALLARTLAAQRIEVRRVERPFTLRRAHGYFGGGAARREVPAGAYVVSMAQPQKRLAKALLELEPGFTPEFLASERRKKERAELTGRRSRDGFYDATAWSLPLMFGVDAVWAEDAPPAAGLSAPLSDAGAGPAPAATTGAARYGWLYDGTTLGGMRLTAQLLREGFNVAVATEPFRVQGRDFARGAIVARTERNPAALRERVLALAGESAVPLHSLEGARVESGSDFGEDPIVELRRPRIAVVAGEPTDDRGFGATWFTLEQRLGYPFTAIALPQLLEARLSDYDVVVLPHGAPSDWQELLGEAGLARLRRWTQDGGTLVLVKGAAAMATRSGVGWTSSTLKRHTANVRFFFDEPSPAAEAARARSGSDTARGGDDAITRQMDLVRTAGAILRVKVDPEHFLGYGYAGDVGAIVSSNFAFTISRDGINAAAFPDERSLRLAGWVWPEAQRALGRTLYAWAEPAGRGQVILFADDPNFRAAQLSTLGMFFNAVILGPSFTR